eukprot:2035028-Amphidinium_carterae.1
MLIISEIGSAPALRMQEFRGGHPTQPDLPALGLRQHQHEMEIEDDFVPAEIVRPAMPGPVVSLFGAHLHRHEGWLLHYASTLHLMSWILSFALRSDIRFDFFIDDIIYYAAGPPAEVQRTAMVATTTLPLDHRAGV